MAGNEVKIILTAVDKASAVLNKAGGNIKKHGADWNKAFNVISVGALAAGTAVVGFVAKTIDSTIKYADQVRELSRLIGASAEESSKLIQAADDVFVSYEELTAGMRVAIRKGIEPSIDGMGKLADQYLAIQDPIARSKFLMDTFGRAGAKLAPLLEKGSEGIKKLGENAEKAGLVLDRKALAATLRYKESLDELNDSWAGFSLVVGLQVIPKMTTFIKLMNDFVAADTFGAVADASRSFLETFFSIDMSRSPFAQLGYELEEFENAVDPATKALQRNREAAAGLQIPYEELAAEVADANTQMATLNQLISGQLGPEMVGFRDTTQNLKDEAEALRTKIGELERQKWLSSEEKAELEGLKGDLAEIEGNITATADAHDEATKRILFNILTQRAEMDGLSAAEAEALNKIALQWGLVDTATYNAMQKANEFFQEVNSGADTSRGRIQNLKRAMLGLPSTHEFDLIINIYKKMYESTIYDNNRQHGGPVAAGMPYIVGEAGPELFIPRQGGKIVPNNRLTGSGGTGAGGGGDILIGDINIFASPGMNEEQLARLVIARLSAAARHSGYAGLDYAG